MPLHSTRVSIDTSDTLAPCTIQNIPVSLHKFTVKGPSKSPTFGQRKVFNINKDTQNRYEEMKVGGTLESDDEDYNPFSSPEDQTPKAF